MNKKIILASLLSVASFTVATSAHALDGVHFVNQLQTTLKVTANGIAVDDIPRTQDPTHPFTPPISHALSACGITNHNCPISFSTEDGQVIGTINIDIQITKLGVFAASSVQNIDTSKYTVLANGSVIEKGTPLSGATVLIKSAN